MFHGRIHTSRTVIRPGEFLCQKCGGLSLPHLVKCEHCSAPRPPGALVVGRWRCGRSACAADNAPARSTCWSCGAARGSKDDDSATTTTFGNSGKKSHQSAAASSLPLQIDASSVRIASLWRCRCGAKNSKAQNRCSQCKAHRSMTR